MVKKILIVLAIAVIGFVVFVATRPAAFQITRSAVVSAPADVVFAQLNDFHNWDAWSPWAKLDPNMKVTHGTPASGNGAHFSWEGTGKVGAGKLTITESRPNELVRCQLDFYKPFRCTNSHEFVLKPEGSQTRVTWTMNGKSPFVFKLFLVFASCDRMMGKDLERGLANLKAVAAGQAA